MSSADVVHVTSLRDSHHRRRRTCQRVFTAAAQLLDESSDAPGIVDVSLPALAARARVAPTALRAHFDSLDAMFAELYLHRICALPLNVDPGLGAAARVSAQLRAITMVLADEPRLSEACSRALLRNDDDVVADVRTRIGAEVQRRIAAALGAGAWPEVQATLETVFWGALLQVRSRSVSCHRMADRLDTMLALILSDADH
ncbi:TetR family transcriptional regulator [Mycobacterium sp. CPCC 205372]|uniref:TetR family transcriptional regulator n=1 Tax=Mycobacterium hippophais TaxID=3016340 RepID=A0ABT4PVJ0_9MYCO|nr:TetR family transcriptional regulator [Mycobacterium hippophais]MCZ8380577.1 TetR family transcriptional regulator [Mycobacterium hippophais]